MRIAFISEYFPPFTPGGAEWSAYYLAKELSEVDGIMMFILTPNYGAQEIEMDGKLSVRRFPFYRKIKNSETKLSNFTHLNPVWILWQAWYILKFAKRESIDLIHVQGKYSLPAVYLANFILRKKLITTIRDYQVICNYGFCIYNKNKACGINEYFSSDFQKYWNEYVTVKNLNNLIINLIYAVWGRISSIILRFFAKKYNVVVLSQKQAEIFKANGFSKVRIIHNSISFEDNVTKVKREKQILFAGRLTPGKGVGLLMDLLPSFFSEYPDYKFIFAGDGMLKDKLLDLAKDYDNLVILGAILHNDLMDLYKTSSVTVVPSIWQEPFGRIALESLKFATPVVVTDRGGLPEIVDNNKWGFIVKPNSLEILQGIKKAIKANDRLINQIILDYSKIKSKFGKNIIEDYLKIYKG